MFLVGIIYLMYVIVKALFFGIDQPGYASLMSVILFIGSLQFIFLGIIGEYVGRMFLETKKKTFILYKWNIETRLKYKFLW